MTRLLLVRHAKPTATWDAHPDPGLSAVGVRQAAALATRLATDGPRTVVTSPLARARETAVPLAARLGIPARIEAGVGEIPTYGAVGDDRKAWLRELFAGPWDDTDATTREWRRGVLDALSALSEDTVVFTHYVAINVAVGAATGDDRVRCCSPAHASVTEIEADGPAFHLVTLGDEAITRVT